MWLVYSHVLLCQYYAIFKPFFPPLCVPFQYFYKKQSYALTDFLKRNKLSWFSLLLYDNFKSPASFSAFLPTWVRFFLNMGTHCAVPCPEKASPRQCLTAWHSHTGFSPRVLHCVQAFGNQSLHPSSQACPAQLSVLCLYIPSAEKANCRGKKY